MEADMRAAASHRTRIANPKTISHILRRSGDPYRSSIQAIPYTDQWVPLQVELPRARGRVYITGYRAIRPGGVVRVFGLGVPPADFVKRDARERATLRLAHARTRPSFRTRRAYMKDPNRRWLDYSNHVFGVRTAFPV